MNLSDPTIAGSLIGVAGGLVGVLVGVWAAKFQFQSEYVFRKRNGFRALVVEITLNQSGLIRDLDRVLPAWLARTHRVGPAGIARVADLLSQARIFDSAVYDALFAELIGTEFGSELMSYYRRIAWLNAHVPPQGRLDIDSDFGTYVNQLASGILIADDLVRALDKDVRKSRIRPWGKNRDVENFLAMSKTHLFLAHLAQYDLNTIRNFLVDGEKPPGFPKILESDPDRLDEFRRAAESL